VLAGASPCGRTNTRIKGWMGRADQTTKARGLFVHPEQVAQVVGRHGLGRGRLIVDNDGGNDLITLRVERDGAPDLELMQAVETTLRDVTKLRGEVHFVATGTLPNDGKVIEDARKYA
jgi:phenylacetate-CoA ligase